MVLLRSGKDIPFLGKNIPKRSPLSVSPRQTQRNEKENTSENSQQVNSEEDHPSSILPEPSDTCQNASLRSSVSSNDSNENSSLSVRDLSTASDQSTRIDDTLEITDYEDSCCTDKENQSFVQSHTTKRYFDFAGSSQSITKIVNTDTINQTQSEVCDVADLSWF